MAKLRYERKKDGLTAIDSVKIINKKQLIDVLRDELVRLIPLIDGGMYSIAKRLDVSYNSIISFKNASRGTIPSAALFLGILQIIAAVRGDDYANKLINSLIFGEKK